MVRIQEADEFGLGVVRRVGEVTLDRRTVDPPDQLHQVPPRPPQPAGGTEREPTV